MGKILVKVVVLFLAVGFFVSVVAMAFSDVDDGSYLMEAVSELKLNGIVDGYQDGSFKPDLLINRAEFIKIVVNGLRIPPSGTQCFPDVGKQWFAAYVCAAKDSGFVKGYGDGYFWPDKKINLAEVAKVLILASGLKVEETGPWYEVYVDELSERIILPESVDAVDDLLTRGEVAEIVYSVGLKESLTTSLNNAALEVESSVGEWAVGDLLGDEVVDDSSADGVVISAPSWQNVFFGSEVDCESNPEVKFTAPFVDMGDVVLFTPPGEISGGSVKPHSFIEVVPNKMVPVYAPADSVLVSGVYYIDPKDPDGPGEYALDFLASCEFNYKFAHIDEVIPAIKDLFPDTPQTGTQNPPVFSKSLSFKAGDLIAYTNGTDVARRFDFGAYHSGHRNYFVNMERYNYKLHSLHSVCPYDYFVEDLQPAFFDKFGSIGGKLLPNAECQLATQDMAGTISGAWFSIADLGVDWVAMGVEDVAIGRELGGGAVRISTTQHGDIWVPVDWQTFKDPKEVTDEHCYFDDRERGIVYLKLVSDMEMWAFFDPTAEACPVAFPESGYEVYYR